LNFKEQQSYYIKARSLEGRVLSDADVLELPISKVHCKEWGMRRHAFSKLSKYLKNHKPINGSVLDLGCGNGWMSNQISDIGFDVTGVDVNDLEVAQGNRLFPNVEFHVGNVFDLELKKFDFIVIAGAFQYFDNTTDLFVKLKSMLKENGKLIILETFFYTEKEAKNAKQSSDDYYKSIGVSEMGSFYFHQKWDCLSSSKYRVIYRLNVIFKLLNKVGGNYSPFPIIELSL
jgi:ubiquinone/menaquinone biosynthesis C-methylase UbiE